MEAFIMKQMIELNDALVKRAKELSNIDNVQELMVMTLHHYVDRANLRDVAQRAKAEIGDTNIFWDDYDPKA
jgi:hypothetical protein